MQYCHMHAFSLSPCPMAVPESFSLEAGILKLSGIDLATSIISDSACIQSTVLERINEIHHHAHYSPSRALLAATPNSRELFLSVYRLKHNMSKESFLSILIYPFTASSMICSCMARESDFRR